MKIKVNKTLAQVAKEFAAARNFGWEPKLLEDGEFVALPTSSSTEFGQRIYDEWYSSEYPFGVKGWRHLWRQFGRWVETDQQSVHGGSDLPADGVAVLMVEDQKDGEFAVICQQWVEDPIWWDWTWQPVAVVARA